MSLEEVCKKPSMSYPYQSKQVRFLQWRWMVVRGMHMKGDVDPWCKESVY